MTPAQAQYGQFGKGLPYTGVNLTAVGVVSGLLILAGLFILFAWGMRGTPRGRI